MPPLDKEHFVLTCRYWIRSTLYNFTSFSATCRHWIWSIVHTSTSLGANMPPLSVPVSGSFNIRSCKPPLSSSILPSSTMNLSHFQLLIISFSCLNFISFPSLHLPLHSLTPELLHTFPSSVPFQISSPHLLWFHALLSSRISLVYGATIRLYEHIKRRYKHMCYTYKKKFIALKQTKKVVTDQEPSNSDPYNGAHQL